MLLTLHAVSRARGHEGSGTRPCRTADRLWRSRQGLDAGRYRPGEFLVARRVLDDASGIAMHGTIEGLVPPYVPEDGKQVVAIGINR